MLLYTRKKNGAAVGFIRVTADILIMASFENNTSDVNRKNVEDIRLKISWMLL